MLKIEVSPKLNLAQVLALAQAGKSVVQTPHVGNFPPDVQVALQSGLHVRLVDTNIGVLDKLFYPQSVVCGGQEVFVADPRVLVTHATVISSPLGVMGDHFPLGRDLSTAHVEAARVAFPGADIVPYAMWLRPYQELILRFLEPVTQLHPTIWERRVDRQGITENAQRAGVVPTWDRLMAEGICGITVPASAAGWVLPNPLSILVDIIVDAAAHGRNEQYALSGPSMATYIQQNHRNFGPMDKLLDCWYSLIASRLPNLRLSKKFLVHMVPAASWQLAVPMGLKDNLDALVGWYFDYRRRQVDIAQGIALGTLNPTDIGGIRRSERDAVRAIADPILLWLTSQAKPSFATQYDVLLSGEPLYVHPIVHNTSVKSLAEVVAFFRATLSV